ncbi:MAG: Lipopolysaccharide assembly protein B [Ignavibacteriaceae bacterium]|jgi:tetratricopeptide (TPR) repeat protein|nr:Lipopolysaccharide assembly protein B [Ignavibacteriaceae bacterium]MCO6446852.1 tetratricopeptide repeat protein [Ignavibacterium album]MDT3696729.1 tetratricopeptide repeat protein [Ignavibacterium sp.]QQS37143.1 MAG: tetratricopeptide repeat protein [Ignavibacteriales bacterium]GIK61880.1 MAG: hypothetical protein BroJett017_27700 [Ignavibacteriota bacterium]
MKRILILVEVLLSFIFIKAQDSSESAAEKEFNQSYDKGVKYFFEGNIPKAEDYFQLALNNKPDDINTLKYLAEISIAKQNIQMIQYYYERVLELDSNDEDALISLGVINLNDGNFDKAESLLAKAVNIQPDNEQALYNLSVLYGTIGEFPKAVNTLKKLIAINPYNSENYQTLGLFYLSQNLYTDAEKYFFEALRLDNNLIEARKGLVIIYQNQNRLKKSLEYLNGLEAISPDLQHLNILKASQQYLEGKIKTAIKYALLEIKNYPQEADAYYMLSDLYKIIGDESESRLYLVKAKQLNENNSKIMVYSLLNIK